MTPHISRGRILAIGTAVASGALVLSGLTAGASAQPNNADVRSLAGAPLTLSGAAHTSALKAAQSDAAATAKKLGLGAQEKLVVKDVVKDRDGVTHTRYERTYGGLPVLGGDLVVHTAKSGATKGVTRASDAKITVDTSSSLATKAAPKGARKVVWAAKGTPVLAYEKITDSTAEDGTPSRVHTITDAASGKKLFSYDDIRTGLGHSQFSGDVEIGTKKAGNGYELTDDERGGTSTYDLHNGSFGTGDLLTDDDDEWGDGTINDPATAGVDAAYGAEVTWDYYADVHGRSGIAGDGEGSYSRVHYGDNYVNAFWDDSCFCMTYGDGFNNEAPLTALDVTAHEMSHGVTSTTAGLIYSGESGGLNEGTSDIFASAVEFYADAPDNPGNYLIGEQIDINGDGSPLRYMDQPSKDGISLDNWSSSAGNTDVHYSSGIANHFFYLLSEGSGQKTINGIDYDSPTANGEDVPGIGRDAAEQIWFKALTEYMTSTTDYHDARDATLSAAADLFGEDSTEYATVDATWAAVNVS